MLLLFQLLLVLALDLSHQSAIREAAAPLETKDACRDFRCE
jgi:hypothetical protein